MRFLIDAQLPRRIALWLREAGHDAMHTLDLPARNRTPDVEILKMAAEEKRVVVTKDAISSPRSQPIANLSNCC